MSVSLKLVTILAFGSLTCGGPVFAEGTTPAAESHEQHEQNEHGMNHDCMGEHKDGKKCEHHAKMKCDEKMKPEDCEKMMKQEKKAEKKK